jgi:hypothetical protein
MRPAELFDELKRRNCLRSDSALAQLIGLTPARISQMRSRKHNLTARQLAGYIQKATERGRRLAYSDPIRPIVEMYPIDAVRSKQEAKWEPLATGKKYPRNQAIRKMLEAAQGLYMLYDSQGCAIYAGKTTKLGIWKEMTNAFNRERSNHQAFFVSHPTTGSAFSPAWKTPRQPQKQIVYLHDTAHYFSAYEVEPELILNLEALVIRAFCNSLSNKKMEKFSPMSREVECHDDQV